MSTPAFMLESPCARIDPEAMFPEAGDAKAIAFAKRTCRDCFARTACLEWALTPATRANFGIWGGLDEDERRELIRRQKRGPAARISYGPRPPLARRHTAAV
ncbi:WhiB family transcriptional regulator [Streptomyces sp. NPDC054871]